jgi:hypothetical protein
VANIWAEQNQQGQGAFCRVQPAFQLTAGSLQVGVMEGVAKAGVKGLVLGEPTLGAGVLPEVDDGFWGGHGEYLRKRFGRR